MVITEMLTHIKLVDIFVLNANKANTKLDAINKVNSLYQLIVH